MNPLLPATVPEPAFLMPDRERGAGQAARPFPSRADARRSRRCLAALAAVVALAAGVAPAAQAGQPVTPPEPPKAVSQQGLIRTNGCVVDAKDLSLTATPMVVANGVVGPDAAEPESGEGVDPVTGVHKAKVSATKDPRVFSYVVHALKVTKLYTLDIRVEGDKCGRMTWIGPARGVIAPGQRDSIDINGIALTTQIDVLTSNDAGQAIYRAADFVRPDDTVRQFRWSTNVPEAAGVELQISADPFPSAAETAATCGAPPGLLAKAQFVGRNGLSKKIDFSQALPVYDETSAGELAFHENVPPGTRYSFQNGMPLYVRAIPLRADGVRLCDLMTQGAAGWSLVAFAEHLIATLQKSPALLIDGTYFPAHNVIPADHCVRAVKPHLTPASLYVAPFQITPDWLGYSFRQAGKVDANGWVQPGELLCWNQSTSTIDDIGNFITGFVDGIASIVNFVANLYNSIKADIVQFVADAISVIPGISCTDFCKDVINGVLTTAMTSMGLPPSLPDFDALVNDGIDYLKEQVIEQSGATGLAKVAAEQLVDGVIDAAKSQGTRGGGGLPDWVVKDNGFRPARLVLEVTPNALKLNEVPDHLRIGTSYPQGLYPLVRLPLPAAMRSGRSFTIPVQLAPDLRGTADLYCGPLFSTADCAAAFPEQSLAFKLNDWYAKRFAPASCSEFRFASYFYSETVYGTRAVVPQYPADLGGDDLFCL